MAEGLKDTVERTLPYWFGEICPALERGKTVLVAAHGNSIRGMLKYELAPRKPALAHSTTLTPRPVMTWQVPRQHPGR